MFALEKMAAKPKPKKTPTERVNAIKGFDRNLACRGFQYEIGQTYTHDGKAVQCESGFHACDAEQYPLDVFAYYPPAGSRYCDVVQAGQISRDDSSSKLASTQITIGIEITLHDLILRAVEFVMSRAKGDLKQSNSGDCGAASNSGTRGAASNSGERGAASNSGTRGAASNSGYSGAASNSGTRGAAFSHARYSKVMCEGDGQALYCTEIADDGSIASVACGITGKDGVKAGQWYSAKDGTLVEQGA